MFLEDFEALIYDFGGMLIILTPNLSFIKACPLFYKQNIQRFGSFKDRPIFRCYFLLLYSLKYIMVFIMLVIWFVHFGITA